MIAANGLAAIVEVSYAFLSGTFLIIQDGFQVNCQTDFVARNETFRSSVARISRGIFTDAARNYRLENNDISTKVRFSIFDPFFGD